MNLAGALAVCRLPNMILLTTGEKQMIGNYCLRSFSSRIERIGHMSILVCGACDKSLVFQLPGREWTLDLQELSLLFPPHLLHLVTAVAPQKY
jgi:hypothetical protein